MAKPAKKKTSVSKKNFKKPLKGFVKLVKKIRSKISSKPVKSKTANKLRNKNGSKIDSIPLIPIVPVTGSLPTSPPLIFVTPEPPQAAFELPASYGDNKIALLIRDPWWIYAYWEVTSEREGQVMRHIESLGAKRDKLVLRVYDVTGGSVDSPRSSFDIEMSFLTGNWYVDVGIPDRDWITDFGIRTRDGRFFMLVRSNVARTPRFGVSEILDEEWMLPDDIYWKLFGLSGGLADRKSSLDVRDILEKYLKSIVSSSGFSSFGRAEHVKRELHPDIGAKILERPSSA
jgi:hypothetical protein